MSPEAFGKFLWQDGISFALLCLFQFNKSLVKGELNELKEKTECLKSEYQIFRLPFFVLFSFILFFCNIVIYLYYNLYLFYLRSCSFEEWCAVTAMDDLSTELCSNWRFELYIWQGMGLHAALWTDGAGRGLDPEAFRYLLCRLSCVLSCSILLVFLSVSVL